MKGHFLFIIGIFTCLLFHACGSKTSSSHDSPAGNISQDSLSNDIAPRYAEGYKVTLRADSVRLLEIQEPANPHAPVYQFALVPKGKKVEAIPDDYQIINIPVDKVICMTMPQLAGFSMMNEYDKVTGTSNTHRVQNKEWLKRLADGRVKKIGIEGNFDTEIVLAAQPDIIFVSPNRRGGYEVLKEVGIPLIPYWAFKETSPLGLSEWIKVVGIFICQEDKACRIFSDMENKYNKLKETVAKVKHKPVVFSGEMRQGNWYIPGGKSFYARLFEDAGADYIFKDDPHTGGVLLDYETVYVKAHDAEYWRVMNAFKGNFTYQALKDLNSNYTDFRAFREKKVVYCNLEYIPLYENLPSSPHILLEDMVKAFHPELLPDHQSVYYQLLKE